MLDLVLPDVPGCPTVLAAQRIRQAAIELCELGMVYRTDIVMDMAANSPIYTLPVPDQTVMNYPLKVVVYGIDTPLSPGTIDQFDALWGQTWRDPTNTDDPRFFFSPGLNQVQLVRSPGSSVAQGLTFTVSLKPTQLSTMFPADLFELHAMTIQHRALALLMAMPGKPWSNPATAAWHNNEFDLRMHAGANRAGRNGVRATLRTASSYIGRIGTRFIPSSDSDIWW